MKKAIYFDSQFYYPIFPLCSYEVMFIFWFSVFIGPCCLVYISWMSKAKANPNVKSQGKPKHEASGRKHLKIFVSCAWPIKSNSALKPALGSDRLNGLLNKHWSCHHTWVMVCLNYKSTEIHSFHFLREKNLQGIPEELTIEFKGGSP